MTFTTLTHPLPALLHVGGHTYEIEVVRQRRGRYQVRLAESEPKGTRIIVTRGARVLVHGVTTSVPISAVELR